MRFVFLFSNHCWVSFSGFTEAYNVVYADEIQKYGQVIGSLYVCEFVIYFSRCIPV